MPERRSELLIAKFFRHQLVPEIADAKGASRPGRLLGEAITGKTRHDDIKRIRGVATMRRWVGQQRDQLLEANEESE